MTKLVFLGIGWMFFSMNTSFAQTHKGSVKQAKNVILLIGNGMGISQLYAGMIAQKGETNFSRFNAIGFAETYSASDFSSESAAAATALATGIKTHNGAIGVDENDQSVPNIREIAQKNGLATGMVVTSPLAAPIPGAFIAHVKSKEMQEQIAKSYVTSGIDVFIGGQGDWFYNPKRNINLVPGLRKHNFQICIYPGELSEIKKGKLAASLSLDWAPKRGDVEQQATQKAIQLLSQDGKGFFLMIAGSRIGAAAKDQKFDRMVAETRAFDKVVGRALDFAKEDGHTLVVVTATNEMGGLALSEGNREDGKVKGAFMFDHPSPVMVPVFAYGPGAEAFIGIYENTAIFHKMAKANGFEK